MSNQPTKPGSVALAGPTAPRVRGRVVRDVARRGVRGLDRAFYESDRKLALAMKQQHGEYVAELGDDVASASASALIWSIVVTKLRRDTIAALVIELGPRCVNRKRRAAYPIVAQLNEIERLLADLLRQFQQTKADTEIERRLEALENGRVINVP